MESNLFDCFLKRDHECQEESHIQWQLPISCNQQFSYDWIFLKAFSDSGVRSKKHVLFVLNKSFCVHKTTTAKR